MGVTHYGAYPFRHFARPSKQYGDDAKTYAKIKGATSAAARMHKQRGMPSESPSTYGIVQIAKDKLKRRLGSAEHLAAVREAGHIGDKCRLSDASIHLLCLRFYHASDSKRVQFRQAMTVLMTSIAGFFRPHEALCLLIGDVIDLADIGCSQKGYIVFIESSKKDNARVGAWVTLTYATVTESKEFDGRGTSGGAWLRHWLLSERKGAGPLDHVFGVAATGSRSLRDRPLAGDNLSYSSYFKDSEFKSMIEEVGLDPKFYAPHTSGRATGASIAADIGVNDRLLMKHGRWSSETIKNQYVTESLDQMMELSIAMEERQTSFKVDSDDSAGGGWRRCSDMICACLL